MALLHLFECETKLKLKFCETYFIFLDISFSHQLNLVEEKWLRGKKSLYFDVLKDKEQFFKQTETIFAIS